MYQRNVCLLYLYIVSFKPFVVSGQAASFDRSVSSRFSRPINDVCPISQHYFRSTSSRPTRKQTAKSNHPNKSTNKTTTPFQNTDLPFGSQINGFIQFSSSDNLNNATESRCIEEISIRRRRRCHPRQMCRQSIDRRSTLQYQITGHEAYSQQSILFYHPTGLGECETTYRTDTNVSRLDRPQIRRSDDCPTNHISQRHHHDTGE